jgi:hypothetical protein
VAGREHGLHKPNVKPLSVAADTYERHILLSSDSSTQETLSEPLNPYWRLRYEIEHRFPTQYDYLRQALLSRREANLQGHKIPRRSFTPVEDGVSPVVQGKQRAVLLGLHWLDLGGAERWAIEAVALVREAGLLPIVITDRPSHQPWIDRPELDGALVICLTHPLDAEKDTEPLLTAIFENFSIAGVMVHHSAWLYDRLPWIKRLKPGIPVADSLHIIEYAGGGYPALAVHLDDFIDTHHVISPQLVNWLSGRQGVPAEKIALAPLIGLTTGAIRETVKPRVSKDGFTIGFVGRFTRQKRPYLFLTLVRTLAQNGFPVQAIMHGSGELEATVRKRIESYGLGDRITVRNHDVPVNETYDDIDCLILSSQNEGITLTTLEGIAGGVPVLSADVGSQSTLVPPGLLVPRAPHEFVRKALATLDRLKDDEGFRSRVWTEELSRAQEFSKKVSAEDWTRGILSEWNK